MPSKPVVKMGNKQLATPSDIIMDLDKSLPDILMLIQDMKDLLRHKIIRQDMKDLFKI